ncbi:MAG TPA: hypothetical protein PKZ53_00440, partial [Acidobacteriota bacterium]|nr:hypothetical protein [Acidobacteriota bacterium]
VVEIQRIFAEGLRKAAAGADVIVLCIGENAYAESPGNTRDLALPKEQEALALLSDPDLAEFAVGLDTFWATNEQIETGIEKAVNFVEEHPRSLYCPIVRTKLNQMLEYLKSSDRLLSPKLQNYFKKFLDEKGAIQSR